MGAVHLLLLPASSPLLPVPLLLSSRFFLPLLLCRIEFCLFLLFFCMSFNDHSHTCRLEHISDYVMRRSLTQLNLSFVQLVFFDHLRPLIFLLLFAFVCHTLSRACLHRSEDLRAYVVSHFLSWLSH